MMVTSALAGRFSDANSQSLQTMSRELQENMLTLATKFKPTTKAFQLAHRAGFRAAEFWLNGPVLADWEGVNRVARQHAMSYVLHFPNQLNLGDESLVQAVKLYRSLGCRTMVIHQPMFDRYAHAMLALDPKLCLAVENHDLSANQFASWANANSALTLDVEHLWKFTLLDAPLDAMLDAFQRFLELYGEKLKHVHLPGYLLGQAEHRPMNCNRDMVFQVLSLLSQAGFAGFVVSEVMPAFQNMADLRGDALLFDNWLASRDASAPPNNQQHG